jgi:hypothetical protein
MVDYYLVERVVSRLVDILGPQLAAQTPSRACEDLREAPQGLHEGAPEGSLEGLLEQLLASEPLASSTEVRPRVEVAESSVMTTVSDVVDAPDEPRLGVAGAECQPDPDQQGC